MIRLVEILAIVGFTGISYIGIVIAKGGKKSAIAISVAVSIALIIYNAKLEDETGKGIVGNVYCSIVHCQSDDLVSHDPPEPAAPDSPSFCEAQLSAWKVELEDFRARETIRNQQCQQTEDDQITLNSELFELRAEWPVAFSFLESCYKDKNNENPAMCIQAVCLGSTLAGYDCKPLQSSLYNIYNRQEEYLKRFQDNNCSMNSDAAYFDIFGLKYTKPVSILPTPPAQPECAKSNLDPIFKR